MKFRTLSSYKRQDDLFIFDETKLTTMNYLHFRKQCEAYSYEMNQNNLPQASLLQRIHMVFDELFAEISKSDVKQIPFWLFRLFDRFVRIIEKATSSKKDVSIQTKILVLELQNETKQKLGKDISEQIRLEDLV